VHTSLRQDPAQMTPRVLGALRNPYVDVLSHVQVELLARSRGAAAGERERAREAILLTVNGIAAGLQTVG
jgi:phosphoenolpyruvate carboxylase